MKLFVLQKYKIILDPDIHLKKLERLVQKQVFSSE